MTTDRGPKSQRGTTCTRCGQVHERCTGHKTGSIKAGTPKPCGSHPLTGLTVCAFHGATKAGKAAGKRRHAQQQAEQFVLANLATAKPMRSLREVYDELLAVAGQAAHLRKVLAERVAKLETLGYEGLTAEQVRADVVLFERSLDRSMKAAELIIRLNIDERREALNERDGQAIAAVIRRILDALNLTPDQAELVPTVVPRELRALTAPKEIA